MNEGGRHLETEQLLAQAIAGDEESLKLLIERHIPAVRVALSGQIPSAFQSAVEVDDVIQVVCLEAALRLRSFSPDGPNAFQIWLKRMAFNALRSALRELRAKKRPDPRRRLQPTQDQSWAGLIDAVGWTTTTPSRIAARNELSAIVEAAVDRLPPDYRQAVRLYDLEGRSAPDSAARMGKSVGAFHMCRWRAYVHLRAILRSPARFFSDAKTV